MCYSLSNSPVDNCSGSHKPFSLSDIKNLEIVHQCIVIDIPWEAHSQLGILSDYTLRQAFFITQTQNPLKSDIFGYVYQVSYNMWWGLLNCKLNTRVLSNYKHNFTHHWFYRPTEPHFSKHKLVFWIYLILGFEHLWYQKYLIWCHYEVCQASKRQQSPLKIACGHNIFQICR